MGSTMLRFARQAASSGVPRTLSAQQIQAW
jgi:hypothetical protein